MLPVQEMMKKKKITYAIQTKYSHKISNKVKQNDKKNEKHLSDLWKFIITYEFLKVILFILTYK